MVASRSRWSRAVPYVPEVSYLGLAPEFAHEPAMSLRGGDDGLDHVRALLRDAPSRLAEGGFLVVEVGEAREALLDAYPSLPFLWLDFERGGDGVFLLERDPLLGAGAYTSAD